MRLVLETDVIRYYGSFLSKDFGGWESESERVSECVCACVNVVFPAIQTGYFLGVPIAGPLRGT